MPRPPLTASQLQPADDTALIAAISAESAQADALSEAFDDQDDSIDRKALAAAIATGSVAAIIALLNLDSFRSRLVNALQPLITLSDQVATDTAGEISAALIPAPVAPGTEIVPSAGTGVAPSVSAADMISPPAPGVQPTLPGPAIPEPNVIRAPAPPLSYDALDAATVARQQAQRDAIVDLLTGGQKDTTSAVLDLGIRRGYSAEQLARDIKTSIGLTERQAKAVANFRTLLETNDPASLDRALRDRRFDPSIERAILEGEPLDDARVDRMVERYAERMRAYRATTIARNATMDAAREARTNAWEQAIKNGVAARDEVRRYWLVNMDEKLCASCATVPMLNPAGVGADEQYMTVDGPVDGPGLHPNCRCSERYEVGYQSISQAA